MTLGEKLKKLRTDYGLTQEELAEKVGVGVTHISHLETGSGTVSLKVFLSIVNYLECSADELLCKEITTARPIVDNWLVDLVEKYNILPLVVGYDRYSAQYLIQDLNAYGFKCDDVWQGENLYGLKSGFETDGLVQNGANAPYTR